MYRQKNYANWYIKGYTEYTCSKEWNTNLLQSEYWRIRSTARIYLIDLSDLNQEKKYYWAEGPCFY